MNRHALTDRTNGTPSRSEPDAAIRRQRALADYFREQAEGAEEEGGGRTTSAEWVGKKHQLAVDRYLAGDLYGALRLVDAILALEPDTGFKAQLRQVRRRCAASSRRRNYPAPMGPRRHGGA